MKKTGSVGSAACLRRQADEAFSSLDREIFVAEGAFVGLPRSWAFLCTRRGSGELDSAVSFCIPTPNVPVSIPSLLKVRIQVDPSMLACCFLPEGPQGMGK